MQPREQRGCEGQEQRPSSRSPLRRWSQPSFRQVVSLPQVAALLVVWTVGVIGLSSWWLAPDVKTDRFVMPAAADARPPVPASTGARHSPMVAGGAQALQPPNRQKLEDELLASLEMVALEVSSKQQYDPTNVEPDDGNEFRPFFQKLYSPDDLHPHNCTHGPNYAALNTEELQTATIAERCHVCERIYRNSLLWNWKWHYNALCNLVPTHLQLLCYNYACLMASSCPEFITGTCSDGDVRLNPCPAKVVCWNCLKIPKIQTKGCFDGTSPF